MAFVIIYIGFIVNLICTFIFKMIDDDWEYFAFLTLVNLIMLVNV